MRIALCGLGAAFALTVALSCRRSPEQALAAVVQSPTAVAREARLERALAGSDSTAKDADDAKDPDAPLARWVLPTSLNEISGLAFTRDGRLFVQGDESGQVWQVDYRRGVLVKRFSIGPTAIKGDFEGITTVNDVIWMLESSGKLYEFREGADGAHVDFKKYDTELKKECEFEGLAYDAKINSLLLACKNIRNKADRNDVIVYRWSLASDSAGRVSRLMVPVSSIRGANPWTSLQVSDITVDPTSGNYVLIASKERAIIEISPDGNPISARPLPDVHEQPEGVAIAKGMVLVSDEAVKGPATITVYRWP